MRGVLLTGLLGLGLVVVSSGHLQAADAKDLAGTFTSKVTEPSGDTYDGTCEIIHKGGKSLELVWKYGSKKSIGLGKLNGDTLEVEYQGAVANREGKAVYEVKSNDRLVGEWKRKGTKGKGKEILIRAKN
jgi:hypothetical protein